MHGSSNPFAAYDRFPRRQRTVRDYHGKHWGVDAEPETSSGPVTPPLLAERDKRFVFFLGAVFVILLLFGVRLTELQMVRGATLRVTAEENRIRIKPIRASRGILYDRNGEQLVRNIPNLSLHVVPADLPKSGDLRATADTLAAILQEDAKAFFTELRALRTPSPPSAPSFQPVTLRDHLSYETALKLRLAEKTLPGLSVEEEATREYLGGPAFSHILGYTGKISEEELKQSAYQNYLRTDEIGKSGVEASHERLLKGADGKKQVEVDSLGKERRVVATEEPSIGKNIRLSIDTSLQRIAQEALEEYVRASGGSGGAVVALDPRNGEVLALTSAPSFDNNIFVSGVSKEEYAKVGTDAGNPLFNRAVSGQYPPGSTIKPLVASAALQEGVITPKTTVLSTGGIRIGQWFFPDWKAGGHGVTDVRKAIAESINTFFYMVSGGTEDFPGLGIERLSRYLKLFGLGAPLGIDLPSERKGLVPSLAWKQEAKKERWYIGDTYHLAIGQGDVLVTPLQMAAATSVIANGGTLYQPRLLDAIAEQREGDLQWQPVEPVTLRKDFLRPEYLSVVREGMRQTVLSGSARSAQSLPFEIAGKTGSAQFGPSKRTHAWFTAFAPYEQPTIALAVIVESGGEGHAAALPVVKKILERYQQLGHVDNPLDKSN